MMEYCFGGSLNSFKRVLSEQEIKLIVRQIVQGLLIMKKH